MEIIEYPIDGTLDLHAFSPKEVKELVPDYLAVCYDRDIRQVRIIHGKGVGNLRRTVRSILEKNPLVDRFWHEGSAGSWGATIVRLIP